MIGLGMASSHAPMMFQKAEYWPRVVERIPREAREHLPKSARTEIATPSIIVRDLNAYHRMGVRGISCLTFGAFSALAYPINLEMFARATRALDIDSEAAIDDIAAARYPGPRRRPAPR